MISEKRSQAAPANSAKSRGPKTHEGKRQPSRNATCQGLLSDIAVLPGESVEGFEQLLAIHHKRFRPINPFEHETVNEMASCQWRLRRVWRIEHSMMVRAIGNHTNEPTPGDQFAAAFCELADAPRLALLHRYEARLHMMYQRALKNLILARTLPPSDPEPFDQDAPALKVPTTPEVAPERRQPISILTGRPHPVPVPSPEAPAPSSIPPAIAELPKKCNVLSFPNPPVPPHAPARDSAGREPDDRLTLPGYRRYAGLR
jgi:hypothetical protein